MDKTKVTALADALSALQRELTLVNQALLTAAGGEHSLLDAWAAALQQKIAALTNRGRA